MLDSLRIDPYSDILARRKITHLPLLSLLAVFTRATLC